MRASAETLKTFGPRPAQDEAGQRKVAPYHFDLLVGWKWVRRVFYGSNTDPYLRVRSSFLLGPRGENARMSTSALMFRYRGGTLLNVVSILYRRDIFLDRPSLLLLSLWSQTPLRGPLNPNSCRKYPTRHAFGIKADAKDNIAYIDDNRLALPCGNNLVFHNNDAKFQVAIPGLRPSDMPAPLRDPPHPNPNGSLESTQP